MKPVVIIHTNHGQLLPARVSAYAAKSRSRCPEGFDVQILCLEETPEIWSRAGQTFRWWENEDACIWNPQDPQAFMPLRRKVPYLMQFRGKALVVDPDTFAVGDVFDLLSRDMGDKAILCRNRKRGKGHFTGVMLLDCSKLAHWQWHRDLTDLFCGKLNLGPWLWLVNESQELIGELEEEWNHHDTLNKRTKMLHYTNRLTQPWLTGLSFKPDFSSFPYDSSDPAGHLTNPDSRQEMFFFKLLKECMEQDVISSTFIQEEIQKNRLRPDAFDLVSIA